MNEPDMLTSVTRSATMKGQPSPQRLAANRANARLSTGPRTTAGRQASSRNATRHGVLSRHPLLPSEDPAELELLTHRLLEHLAPEEGVEELLVDQIIDVVWRLRRVARVEAALYALGLDTPLQRALSAAVEPSAAVGLAFAQQASNFAVLSRYETALAHRLRRCLQDLARIQAARDAAMPALVALTGGM